MVELYLRRDVRLVEASAYLDLTLPLVRYRTARHPRGRRRPRCRAQPRHRQSVARRGGVQVLRAAAGTMLQELVRGRRDITPEQARLAARSPWHKTSPRKPIPAAIPTIGRSLLYCRQCWRCAIGCRPNTVTTGRCASARREALPPRRRRRRRSHGCRIRRHRLDQPGVRRIGLIGCGARNAGAGGAGGRRSWRRPPTCSRWASRCRC